MGRPKGKENKVTAASRELFASVMEGEMKFIQQELALLRESSGLLPYFMPKQAETEITLNEPIQAPSWFKQGEVQ